VAKIVRLQILERKYLPKNSNKDKASPRVMKLKNIASRRDLPSAEFPLWGSSSCRRSSSGGFLFAQVLQLLRRAAPQHPLTGILQVWERRTWKQKKRGMVKINGLRGEDKWPASRDF
jgi:hypothetical protein